MFDDDKLQYVMKYDPIKSKNDLQIDFEGWKTLKYRQRVAVTEEQI